MSLVEKNFVLKHTFDDTIEDGETFSPIEEHFGYHWSLSMNKYDVIRDIYLNVDQNECKLTPVSVSFEYFMSATENGKQIQDFDSGTFYEDIAHLAVECLDLDNPPQSFKIVDKMLTVEVHVKIVKIFEKSVDSREIVFEQAVKNVKKRGGTELNLVDKQFGLPWRFNISCPKYSLYVTAECMKAPNSNIWSIDAALTMGFKKRKAGKDFDFLSISEPKTLNDQSFRLSTYTSIEEAEEYIVNDEIMLKFIITIYAMTGISETKMIDFRKENQMLTDVCLIADGKKFYVSKMMLAQFSSHFKHTFYGGSTNHQTSEVVLDDDVNSSAFEVFLQIVYCSKPEIHNKNVKNLLILADRFDVPRVTKKCLKFLLTSNDVSIEKKLELADEFNLPDLQSQALNTLKTKKEVKKLRERMEFMSSTTAEALLAKLFSLKL